MIEVLKPGLFSVIQDVGRFEYQEFGMPTSGVLDLDSFRLANWLVGNITGQEVLEVVLLGPSLKFHCDAFVGIVGADMSPMVDGVSVSMNKTLHVTKGTVLSFGKLISGFRSYISVFGGFGIFEEMGSKSTYVNANVGGIEGRALKKGDFFKLQKCKNLPSKSIPKRFQIQYFSTMPIRITEGPEFNLFTSLEIADFLSSEFTLSSDSNRMGIRLEGALLSSEKEEMISSGIVNGTIQVPSNGKPIVLLSEAQTTGGYPRIANVIKSDLPFLGQLAPGSKIRFRKVSLSEAQLDYKNKEQQYARLLNS